jgi:hypothetical protein
VHRTLLPGDNRSFSTGGGLGEPPVLRHVVQTALFWFGVILGFRHSQAAGWSTLPLFLFWAALMTCIWLYLLGISSLLSGHFSALEIAMTVVFGIASLFGIAMFVRLKSSLSWATRLIVLFLGMSIQIVCFRVSFLPAIAQR